MFRMRDCSGLLNIRANRAPAKVHIVKAKRLFSVKIVVMSNTCSHAFCPEADRNCVNISAMIT